jgi:phosphatidylinositol alpha-1,6-mannosyltransferase
MSGSGTVLLVANNFPPVRGGSAVVYDNLARHCGGRVIVVAPRIHYVDGLPLIGWREHDRMAPYRVIRPELLRTVIDNGSGRGWWRKFSFRATDAWLRLRLLLLLLVLIRRERPTAICIGELLASSWLMAVLRRVTRQRLIAYVHGEEITTEDPYDPAHLRAIGALSKADRIVVVSRFTLGAVLALLGPAAGRKTSLIENGVDTERFRPNGKRRDLVEHYHLENCFVFVSVCRLLEKKGIDHAILAFAEVVKTYPDCRFLVVGTGPYEEKLHALAKRPDIAGRVIFAGDVSEEDLVDHYCLGDIFIMPNRELPNGDTEGFGLVFLEANSCGLPVVAGRDGGSRDAVRHGVNGLVVDGGAIAEIAAAMMALRGDAALRARLRQGASEVAAVADWRRKAEEFLQLCTEPLPV